MILEVGFGYKLYFLNIRVYFCTCFRSYVVKIVIGKDEVVFGI